MEERIMNKIKLGIKVHHDLYQNVQGVLTRDLSEIDYIYIKITALCAMPHYIVANSIGNCKIQEIADMKKVLHMPDMPIYDDENGCMIKPRNTISIVIRPEENGTVSLMQIVKAGKLIEALARLLQIPQTNILTDTVKYKKARHQLWDEIDKLNLE